MIGFEDVIRALVPLSFLLIWALTSLFNREAKPLPPRVGGNPPGPGGVRPPNAGPPVRWGPANGQPEGSVARRPPQRPDEDILIIRPEPARPAPASSGTRKAARVVKAPKVEPKKPAVAPQALGGNISQTLNQQLARQKDFVPLEAMGSSRTSVGSGTTMIDREVNRSVVQAPAQAAADWRAMIDSPSRLREAFVLNELLQPPLAQRGPGHLKRGAGKVGS